jgi:hypothetical protein
VRIPVSFYRRVCRFPECISVPVHQAAAEGHGGSRDPVVHAELVKDVGHVGARGLDADEQRLGNL